MEAALVLVALTVGLAFFVPKILRGSESIAGKSPAASPPEEAAQVKDAFPSVSRALKTTTTLAVAAGLGKAVGGTATGFWKSIASGVKAAIEATRPASARIGRRIRPSSRAFWIRVRVILAGAALATARGIRFVGRFLAAVATGFVRLALAFAVRTWALLVSLSSLVASSMAGGAAVAWAFLVAATGYLAALGLALGIRLRQGLEAVGKALIKSVAVVRDFTGGMATLPTRTPNTPSSGSTLPLEKPLPKPRRQRLDRSVPKPARLSRRAVSAPQRTKTSWRLVAIVTASGTVIAFVILVAIRWLAAIVQGMLQVS